MDQATLDADFVALAKAQTDVAAAAAAVKTATDTRIAAQAAEDAANQALIDANIALSNAQNKLLADQEAMAATIINDAATKLADLGMASAAVSNLVAHIEAAVTGKASILGTDFMADFTVTMTKLKAFFTPSA